MRTASVNPIRIGVRGLIGSALRRSGLRWSVIEKITSDRIKVPNASIKQAVSGEIEPSFCERGK